MGRGGDGDSKDGLLGVRVGWEVTDRFLRARLGWKRGRRGVQELGVFCHRIFRYLYPSPGANCGSKLMGEIEMLPANEYVEVQNGGYYGAGTRTGLGAVTYDFRR